MLSRFFHVRSSLKPFAAPSATPTLVDPPANLPGGDVTLSLPHADYDRRPLVTSGFDHYVDWSDDDERFFVH